MAKVISPGLELRTLNPELLIPVDVVNFVTPVKTAGVNWRREQATRQKFYVTSRVTAVPVADGKYKPYPFWTLFLLK